MDTYLVATVTDVAAVHIFGSKIIIVCKNGTVTEHLLRQREAE